MMEAFNMTSLYNNTGLAENATGTFPGGDNSTRTDSGSDGSSRSAAFIPWDNPDNIITKETSDAYLFVLECTIFPIVTVFGLTGNIFSLIVLLQAKMRNSTTTMILVSLAVSDILFLTFNMMRKSTCVMKQFDAYLAASYNAKTFGYLFYLKTAFSRVSTFIVVLISVERFIAVAFPMKVKMLVTKAKTAAAIAVIYVFTLAFLAVIPFQYKSGELRGRPYIATTVFYTSNREFFRIFEEIFMVILFRYIPTALVLFFNLAIITLLRRNRKWQGKQQASVDRKKAKEQQKITTMLLVVALIFIICLIPGDLILIVADVNKGFVFFGKYHNLFLVLSDVSVLFEMVNSSVNFIVYMALNKNFSMTYRTIFRKFVPSWFTTERSSGSSATSRTGDNVRQTQGTIVKSEEKGSSADEKGTDTSSGFHDGSEQVEPDGPAVFSNLAFVEEGKE